MLTLIYTILKRLDAVLLSLLGITAKLSSMEKQLAALQSSVDTLQSSVNAIDQGQQSLTSTVDAMSAKLDSLYEAILPGPAVRLIFNCTLNNSTFFEVTRMIITDTQKFTASIQPVDAKGNPAQVDGVPVWVSSAPTIIAVTPATDGLSAEIVAVGPLGTGQVSVTADADLGPGVTNIAGTLDVEVKAGQAVSLSVSTTTPVEQ